tara:strand:+ start:2975 stop:4030 length:1056 start_codon:yes stop_codon:yes gene_type:complete
MKKSAMGFLFFMLVVVGCGPDYGMYFNKIIVETGDPVIETVTEIEYRHLPVFIPEYIEVEVEVEADFGEIWVDSFMQPLSVNGVDIVWVIDSSGSMNSYTTELLSGIEMMLQALPATGWRLVMISADAYASSMEQQFPLIPGDSITEATIMYNNMTRGQSETGFDSIYSYMIHNPYSQTWMRATASLLVVFVSDEEEQSTSYMPSTAIFTAWYSGLRGGSTYLSAVVNVDRADSVCSSLPNIMNTGHEYMDAVNNFNGFVVDICSTDWSAGVTEATQQLLPYESWELTYEPHDINSIRVFINGALNWDWVYNSSINTVEFLVIPNGNSLVEIGYLYMPEIEDTATGDTGGN